MIITKTITTLKIMVTNKTMDIHKITEYLLIEKILEKETVDINNIMIKNT
ncbi:hypothetical protein NV230_02325 [Mesomycoplasma hyorhinis]|nr:hypothetical protein NV230_02325 [Mesomycoplasma hyorhinis]